jgi:GxxExxY protein
MPNDGTALKHAEITDVVIGCFYDVYNELGHGFLESVYREAMIVALRSLALKVESEKSVQVYFRGERLAMFRTNLVVAEKVIVELKSARALEGIHQAQLLNYLKATSFEVGLLLNFGTRPQFKRMRLDNDFKMICEDPRKSAASL